MVGGRDRYGNGAKNALVIRTDKIGNLIWEKEYSGEGQVNELAYSMSPAINGNYFICITENTLLSPELYQPKIIKIDNTKPTGNIQNWARKERRRILCDIAFEFSANLILGHHSDDLVETIFMRSVKGSGIDGLIGMQEKITWKVAYTFLAGEVFLVRFLLKI